MKWTIMEAIGKVSAMFKSTLKLVDEKRELVHH